MPGSGGAICIWESCCSCGFQKAGTASVCCDPPVHFSVAGMGGPCGGVRHQGVCVSSKKAWARVLFPQRTTSSEWSLANNSRF